MSHRTSLREWVNREVEKMREDVARGCSCTWDARAFRTPVDGCPVHDWKLNPRFKVARKGTLS